MYAQVNPSLAAGTLVGGRYQIVGAIAQGGMGAVYEAHDTRLGNRRCALKALLDAGMTDQEREEAATWFAREAQVLSKLHHALIPNVSDYLTENGHHYLVMDCVQGQTLEQLLEQEGAPGLPVGDVVSWGRQLCSVLHYLHTRQPPVIFRDLKPANIMLEPGGTLKLIDFGIARFLDARRAGHTIYTMIGTPGYCPPEQYQGLADPRSDVYSLGATLHHLISGRDPRRHQPFTFPPLSAIVPDIDPAVEAAIGKAVSLQASDRFANAREFEKALNSEGVAPWTIQAVPPLRAARPPQAAAPGSPLVLPSLLPQLPPLLPRIGKEVYVGVSSHRLHWPPACACCCEPADTHFVLDDTLTARQRKTASWQVPLCSTCAAHAAEYKRTERDLWIALGSTVLAFVALVGVQPLAAVIAAAVILTVMSIRWSKRRQAANALLKSRCCSPGSPIVYYYGDRAHEFYFKSEAYARLFARANHKDILGP